GRPRPIRTRRRVSSTRAERVPGSSQLLFSSSREAGVSALKQQRKARETHVATIFYILYTALSLYVYVLLARVILDLVQVFSREWKPTGFLLVLAEVVYTLTEPPLKMLRKVIPPLRLGQISLVLGFIILLIGVQIIASVFFNLSHASV